MNKACFQCGEPGNEMYGYTICDECKSKLGLFTKDTIAKHTRMYADKPRKHKEEIEFRLKTIEVEYIKKKLKLLHILEAINKN